MTNLDSILKSRDITLPTKPSSQSYGFSSGHVWMWELVYKESWVPKYWCFWTVVLEKTLESPFDCKEIQPVHPKGDQSWVFIGKTGVEAETPILWPPDKKSWLFWKDPDAGKDWRWEEKGTTEDEMVGWHHQFNRCEFGKLRELVMDRDAWRAAVHGSQRVWHDWVTELNCLRIQWLAAIFSHSFILLIKSCSIPSYSPKVHELSKHRIFIKRHEACKVVQTEDMLFQQRLCWKPWLAGWNQRWSAKPTDCSWVRGALNKALRLPAPCFATHLSAVLPIKK